MSFPGCFQHLPLSENQWSTRLTTEQPTAGAGDLTNGSSVIKIPTFYISGTKKKLLVLELTSGSLGLTKSMLECNAQKCAGRGVFSKWIRALQGAIKSAGFENPQRVA
jgi:hypothetical protein